jgi:hypothetical protein
VYFRALRTPGHATAVLHTQCSSFPRNCILNLFVEFLLYPFSEFSDDKTNENRWHKNERIISHSQQQSQRELSLLHVYTAWSLALCAPSHQHAIFRTNSELLLVPKARLQLWPAFVTTSVAPFIFPRISKGALASKLANKLNSCQLSCSVYKSSSCLVRLEQVFDKMQETSRPAVWLQASQLFCSAELV